MTTAPIPVLIFTLLICAKIYAQFDQQLVDDYSLITGYEKGWEYRTQGIEIDTQAYRKGLFDAIESATTIDIPHSNASDSQETIHYSYAAGYKLATYFLSGCLPLNPEFTMDGFERAFTNQELPLSPKSIERAIDHREFQIQQSDRRTAQEIRLIENDFFSKMRQDSTVQMTESGLLYRVLEGSDLPKPTQHDNALIDLKCRLVDGTPVDIAMGLPQPITVTLGGGLIKGLNEGILLMGEGSKYEFLIPNTLAYGDENRGDIPPGSGLIAVVRLEKIIPCDPIGP